MYHLILKFGSRDRNIPVQKRERYIPSFTYRLYSIHFYINLSLVKIYIKRIYFVHSISFNLKDKTHVDIHEKIISKRTDEEVNFFGTFNGCISGKKDASKV